ncbi:DUF397 domain-containing protein [Streptomyces sp. P9-A2]|uniref:DUF397 domain-containing protein n=1 Tax=Streptomyces sp. P9-A2 TaxID=3072284 RepID=UPI002FC9560E
MNTGESFPPVSEATWFKSSYSSGEGGECLEVAWRKSSYSGAEGGECIEIAEARGAVLIRDSKRTSGPVLAVGVEAWAGFVGLAAGR